MQGAGAATGRGGRGGEGGRRGAVEMGGGAGDAAGNRRASSRRGAGARWADKEEEKAEAAGPSSANPARARVVAKPPTAWLYGEEVQGRKVEVLWEHVGEWFEGRVGEYDAERDQHRVAYTDGDVEWVRLGKRRFRWRSNPRPGCAANPSFKGSPRGRSAVGRKVRVFWPAMGKWYIGSIKDYDADKGEHLVAYKDGERQSLQLRNEPIQWLPVEGGDGKDGGKTPGSSGKVGGGGEQQQQQQQQRRERAEQGGRAHSDSKDSEGDAVDPAVFSGRVPKGGRGSRGAGGAASASESEDDADGASPPSGGPKKRKAAGREGGGPKRAKGEPGSSSEGGGVPTTEGPRTPENLEAGETDDEMPPPASREPGARPGVSGQVGSMEPEAGRALVGRRVSVWDTADHRYRKGSVLGFDQEARMAFVRFEDGEREWTDLGKARMKLLGEDSPGGRGQSGSPPGGAATKTGSSGRRSPRRAAGAIDAECSEFGTALGVKVGSRVGLGAVAGESGAAELGHVIAFRPQERLTHILCDDGGDKWVELQGTQWFVSQEAALPRPRHGAAVGWRVGVYWPGDHCFYAGEVLDFSAETGRHFVGYEDGDSEWLRLSRAWVKWVECPPGVQYTPAGGSPAGRTGAAGPAGPAGLTPPAAGGGATGRKGGGAGAGGRAAALLPVSLDMPLAQLRERFYQQFGRKTTSNNKWWLLKKLGAEDGALPPPPRPLRAEAAGVAATGGGFHAAAAAPGAHYQPTPTVGATPTHGAAQAVRKSLEGLRLVFSNVLPVEAEQAMRSARRGPRGDDQRRQLLNRLMKLNTICTYVDSCEQLAHDLEMTNTALPSEFDGLGVSSEVAVNPLSFFA